MYMSKEDSGFDAIQGKYEFLQSNLDDLSTRLEVLLQASAGDDLGKDFEALQNEMQNLHALSSSSHGKFADYMKQTQDPTKLLDSYNTRLSETLHNVDLVSGELASTEKAVFAILKESASKRMDEAGQMLYSSPPQEVQETLEGLKDIKSRYKLMEGLLEQSEDKTSLDLRKDLQSLDQFIGHTANIFREASNHRKYRDLEENGRELIRENELPYPRPQLDKMKPESKAEVTPEYRGFAASAPNVLRRLTDLKESRLSAMSLGGLDNYKGMHELASRMKIDQTSVPIPNASYQEPENFTDKDLDRKLLAEIPPGVYKDIQDYEASLRQVSLESHALASSALKDFKDDLSNKPLITLKDMETKLGEVSDQRRQFIDLQNIPGDKSVEARKGVQETTELLDQIIDQKEKASLEIAATPRDKEDIRLAMAKERGQFYNSLLDSQTGLYHSGMNYDALVKYKEDRAFENPLTQYISQNLPQIEALKSEAHDHRIRHNSELESSDVGIESLNGQLNKTKSFLEKVYGYQDNINEAVASTYTDVSQRIDALKSHAQENALQDKADIEQNLKDYKSLRNELAFVNSFSGPHISKAADMLREMDRQVGDLHIAKEKNLAQAQTQEKAQPQIDQALQRQMSAVHERQSLKQHQMQQDSEKVSSQHQEQQMMQAQQQIQQASAAAGMQRAQQVHSSQAQSQQVQDQHQRSQQQMQQAHSKQKQLQQQQMQKQMHQHYSSQEQQLSNQIDQTKPIYFGKHIDREIEAIISNVGKPFPDSNEILTNAIASRIIADRIGSMPMRPTNPDDPNYQKNMDLYDRAVSSGMPVREEAPATIYNEHSEIDPRVFEINFDEMANPADGSKPFDTNLYLPRMKNGEPVRDEESGAIIQDVIEFDETGNPAGLFLGEPYEDSAIHPDSLAWLKSKGIGLELDKGAEQSLSESQEQQQTADQGPDAREAGARQDMSSGDAIEAESEEQDLPMRAVSQPDASSKHVTPAQGASHTSDQDSGLEEKHYVNNEEARATQEALESASREGNYGEGTEPEYETIADIENRAPQFNREAGVEYEDSTTINTPEARQEREYETMTTPKVTGTQSPEGNREFTQHVGDKARTIVDKMRGDFKENDPGPTSASTNIKPPGKGTDKNPPTPPR